MQPNIFAFDDYRSFLKARIESNRLSGESAYYQDLAKSCRIQKAHFSRIINEKASLNQDQAFRLACAMGMNEAEQEFFSLLVEVDRSGLVERQSFLKEKLRKLRKNYIKSDKRTGRPPENSDLSLKYYGDPLTPVIHLCLLIPSFRNSTEYVEKIAWSLGVTPDVVKKSIETLEELGFVSQANSQNFSVTDPNIHLPKESRIFKNWYSAVSALSSSKILQDSLDNSYAFSASFLTDSASKERIRLLLIDLVEEIKAVVSKTEAEECLQLNIQLFPWTSGKAAEDGP